MVSLQIINIKYRIFMRRLILISVCCMRLTAFSQDVIVTKSGEQIRAKIVEVTEEAVSYKIAQDTTGAVYILTIGKDKIKIISWENGTVDDYEKNLPETKKVENNNGVVKNNDKLPFITKGMSLFYLDNGQVYNEAELKRFLMEQHLGSVWTQYSSGKRTLATGCGLMGGGLGIILLGSLMMTGEQSLLGALIVAPVVLMCWIAGGVLTIVGIPLAISGSVKKRVAINDYNSIYAGKPCPKYAQNVTYKIGVVGNGLGFSLNF